LDAIMGAAPRRVLLGMITPSSNTVLEPVCADLLRGVPGASAHFARVRVTHIALSDAADAQFGAAPMLEAASLLADARVDSICWNGTSASWLGLERDEALCAAIQRQTGVTAVSASLATIELMRRAGVTRFGLVSPYTGDVQARIVANYAALGFECVAERHLDIAENFAFSNVSEAHLAGMAREVAAARPQAISVLCTNLRGAAMAAALETELGSLMLDSTSCAVWGALRAAGGDPGAVKGWGRLFGMS
jgi:maleate isomerase